MPARSEISVLAADLPLFAARPVQAPKAPPNPGLEALEQIDPDTLAPREALELIYRLKALLGERP